MKATIERATLLRGLSHVQSVVERRNTIPILSNVLIEAQSGGTMRLMATDLDLQIDETIPAAVDQPAAITVSAHTLFDIVRKLPEGSQVELAAAEGRITVNAGRAKFTLATLPARTWARNVEYGMLAAGARCAEYSPSTKATPRMISQIGLPSRPAALSLMAAAAANAALGLVMASTSAHASTTNATTASATKK